MKIITTPLIWLLGFFLPQLLIATVKLEIDTTSKKDSMVPTRSLVALDYTQNWNVTLLDDMKSSFDQKQVLTKPSELLKDILWDDIIKKLDQYIEVIKKENKVFRLFTRRKLHLENLLRLRQLTSTVEVIWETFKSSSGYFFEQVTTKNITKKLELIEEKKKAIWEVKMEFYRSKDFSYMFKRGSSIFLQYSVAAIYMPKHLQKNPPELTLLIAITLILIPVVCLSAYCICKPFIRESLPDRLSKYLCLFVFVIDNCIILPLHRMFAYQMKGFLCNPLGLLLPFWYYITMRKCLHFPGNSEYKGVIELIEKEKRVVIEIMGTQKRVKKLCKILENEQNIPKEIGYMIASFVDVSLAIPQVYGDDIRKIRKAYYDMASLPITTLRSLEEYQSLNKTKALSIAFLVVLILMGGVYFGCSLFSVIRAVSRS